MSNDKIGSIYVVLKIFQETADKMTINLDTSFKFYSDTPLLTGFKLYKLLKEILT